MAGRLVSNDCPGQIWADCPTRHRLLTEIKASRKLTHVCLDCGALGVAGGYHDHGNGNAGETIALAAIPGWVRDWQQIEDERNELRETAMRLAKWTQHHPTCARITEAGDCSCGLQEAWEALDGD